MIFQCLYNLAHEYFLVNLSKFSVILHKLLSVLGVSSENFCPRVDKLASFPGLTCLSLAVRNLCRRPGLVHHVMYAAGRIFMSADNICCVASTCTNELEVETSQAPTVVNSR